MGNKIPERTQDGSWPVTTEDKAKIRAFGRELTKFISGYAAGEKNFHIKLVAGGFQYFMMLQDQKARILGDDINVSSNALIAAGLDGLIEEPFEEMPAPIVEDASISPEVGEKEVTPLDAEKPVAEEPLTPESQDAPAGEVASSEEMKTAE